jgi:NADH-quinone oxidoreductase subunit F
MVNGVIGSDPALRVSVGSENWGAGQGLLDIEGKSDTSVTTAVVGSTGLTRYEPHVLATINGKTAFFPRCTKEQLKTVLEELDAGSLPTEDARAIAEHESEIASLPIPDDHPLNVGDRKILSACGWSAPTSIEDYRANRKLIATNFNPEDTMKSVQEGALRGRGRGDMAADTPVVNDWQTAEEADGDPVVVINANDADPNAVTDRLLLESDPFSVCDPALAVARTVGATDVVVYLNEGDTIAYRRTQQVANTLDDELDLEISMRVVTGPDEYKAGEPTMALEAIEGNHRIEARRGPPGPSEYGVNGRPTLIHTPRTFAQIGQLLGGEEFGGAVSDPGTRLFTVVSDGAPSTTVELTTDTTLDAALPVVDLENDWKAACVGGVFGGLTRSLDMPASAPGLTGAHLGTNGVVELLTDSTCIVALAGKRAKFAREENCGRCVPCRQGSGQFVNLLRDVYGGDYKDGMLRELVRTMRNTSLCGFGRDATRPISTAMEEFEPEFNAHANGHCPTGTCDRL